MVGMLHTLWSGSLVMRAVGIRDGHAQLAAVNVTATTSMIGCDML